ncbi:reverse transcriptase family protein [Paraburkholderia sediminicola]|uniref:reverse transcriptase family protein n=1 Tax=Paraburkholderia sediminicola TaxID=458836 RepID=UPI0038B70057
MGVKHEIGEHSFRRICVPTPELMQLQRWIDKNILSVARPHSASVAYSQGKKLIDAAQLHCSSTWLVKLDVKNFFESITEIDVYRVFLSLGYPALLSFELARICTRLGVDSAYARKDVFAVRRLARRKDYVAAYSRPRMGRLPQGAPTSPKLSNLVMRSFDKDMTDLAQKEGMTYTRYADDLCFSTKSPSYTRDRATKLIRSVYGALGAIGLGPNRTKTVVVPPGARKVVLGLTVNDVRPRLPVELKSRMRVHLHYLTIFGPVEHAKRTGFTSTLGMYRHLAGICAFAQQVEPELAKDWLAKLQGISWIGDASVP